MSPWFLLSDLAMQIPTSNCVRNLNGLVTLCYNYKPLQHLPTDSKSWIKQNKLLKTSIYLYQFPRIWTSMFGNECDLYVFWELGVSGRGFICRDRIWVVRVVLWLALKVHWSHGYLLSSWVDLIWIAKLSFLEYWIWHLSHEYLSCLWRDFIWLVRLPFVENCFSHRLQGNLSPPLWTDWRCLFRVVLRVEIYSHWLQE